MKCGKLKVWILNARIGSGKITASAQISQNKQLQLGIIFIAIKQNHHSYLPKNRPILLNLLFPRLRKEAKCFRFV